MGPNLFLFAMPRSGSTQLATWLASHPDIFLPKVKEPNFFTQDGFPKDVVDQHRLNDVDPRRAVTLRAPCQFAVFRSARDYRALYRGANQMWRLDASTSYVMSTRALPRILTYRPDARVIVLVRDPLARALSHYALALRTGREWRSLTQVIADEQNGKDAIPYLLCQPAALNAVQSRLSKDQVLYLRYEEMIEDPSESAAKIAAFLNLNVDLFDLSIRAQNAGVCVRWPRLNRLLHLSGFKSILRRYLPKSLKSHIALVWFRHGCYPQYDPQEVDLLRRALA